MSDAHVSISQLGAFLLEMGASLLSAGAPTKRVRNNLQRVASAYGYHLDDHIEPRTLAISLRSQENDEVFNGTRIVHHHVINFKMISGVSHMSWAVVDKHWSEKELWAEIGRLKALPNYPRLVILGGAAMAGSGFCFTYGGGPLELAITFVATFIGLFCKQELVKLRFNSYIITFLSGFAAGLVPVLSSLVNTSLVLEQSLTTSILFLIPGVPLINSIRDLLDGEITNGIDRGISAVMHTLAIAFSLSALIYIFNLPT